MATIAPLCALADGALGQMLNSQVETEAQQFERIFGHRPSMQPRAISVPFILDYLPHGEIQVILSTNQDAVKIEVTALLQELASKIRPETLEQIRSAADPQDWLSLPQLQVVGLEAEFNEEKLELRIAAPPELRKESIIELSGRRRPPGFGRALPPSEFSAYLNLRSGFDFVGQSQRGSEEGLQPFRLDLEGAVNLHNWVVEGNGSFTEDADNPWRRGNFRLVRDDPAQRIRYVLGDLAYPVTSLQSFQPLVGLTVAKNFSLQPYRVTQPRGATSFFLQAPSKVEVLVNGQPVQTLQLPAGQHNMRDFSLVRGNNEAVLRITDDVGREKTIRLSFFFDPRLLAAGEQEFSYSIGLPARATSTGPEYESSLPAISLLHRIGLSDTWTAGLNFQGNENQQMLGGESVWATPFGILQPDVAVSLVNGIGIGYVARLGYLHDSKAGSLGLAVQHRSPLFSALGNMAPNNAVAWDVSARYSKRLPQGLSSGVGASYQISRGNNRDLSSVNLLLSKRLGRSIVADLTLDRRDTASGQTEYRAFVTLTIPFSSGRQKVHSSYDSFSGTSRADWQYTAQNSVGELSGSLGVQRQQDNDNLYGRARYNSSRAEMSLAEDITTPASPTDQSDRLTRFRFATALVYAEGQMALSRPVQDSFAIIAASPNLKGYKIGVDPVRDTYAATIDSWGPAVLPNLSSYLVRGVTIDAPELPPGYELGPGAYLVRPTYKSGTVIRVGTGATVLLGGILETAQGAPVSLQAGEIVSLAEPQQQEPLVFFTNRRGKFSLEGLQPGRYEICLFSELPSAVRFDIPKGKGGIYDIGTLRLPKALDLESFRPLEESK